MGLHDLRLNLKYYVFTCVLAVVKTFLITYEISQAYKLK